MRKLPPLPPLDAAAGGGVLFGTDKEGRATLVTGGAASSQRSQPADYSLDVHLGLEGVQQGRAARASEPDDWAFLERTPSPLPSSALAALDLEEGRRADGDGAGDTEMVQGGARDGRAQNEAAMHDDDDGAVLLRQFTSAFSASPEQPSVARAGRGDGPASASALRQDERGDEGPSGLSGPSVGRCKVTTRTSTSTRRPQLVPNPLVTPARPDAPTRNLSVGSGLSPLGPDHPLLSPVDLASTVVAAPPLPPTSTSSLARNLVRILSHPERLPVGLFALLEACVREADAGGNGDARDGESAFGSRSTSDLAVRAGLVLPPATSDGLDMPPPARSMRHARSLPTSSSAPSHAGGALSAALSAAAPSTSGGNSTSTSATSTSTVPSGSSHETHNASTPAWTFNIDQLPPLPTRCHPPNPNANLRFIFEYGAGEYEEALRKNPDSLASSQAGRRPSLPPLVASASRRPPQDQLVVERTKRRMSRVDEERLDDAVVPDLPIGGPCTSSSASSSRASSLSRASAPSRPGRMQVSAAAAPSEEATVDVQETAAGPRRSKRAKQGAR
ncbi:hypothetical protein JCM9279_007389 [Rhodotorula babjevae]